MKNIVYCYSKCSTCRKALKWLDTNNIKYELKDIISDHPDYNQFKKIIDYNNFNIKKYFNTSGILYREMNLKDKLKDMTQDEILNLLVSNGMLIKRPLLINQNQVLIGFKEEEWKILLNG